MVTVHHEAYALDECLVCAFTGAVSLGVVGSGHLEINAGEVVECPPEPGDEELVPVGDDVEWEPIFTVPCFKEEVGNVLGRCS